MQADTLPAVSTVQPDVKLSGDVFGALINLSGRRRFTSQRVVLYSVLASLGHEGAERTARDTLAAFNEAHPGETIALAWFDLNVPLPTEQAFEAVLERLVPGGVVAMWQLMRGHQAPAEGIHYLQKVLGKIPHQIHRTQAYPSLCYLTFPEGGRGRK